jgi:hypothetical protein
MKYGKRKFSSTKKSTKRTVRSSKGRHLSKTQRSEVKVLAKKTIHSVAESKVFNSTDKNDIKNLSGLHPRGGGWGGNTFTVRSFAVSTAELGGTTVAAPPSYGFTTPTGSTPAPMIALNMQRLFPPINNVPTQFNANQIEGEICEPYRATTRWQIDFPSVITDANDDGAHPVKVRFIRVQAKRAKYSTVSIIPSQDLFLSQHGAETGVGNILNSNENVKMQGHDVIENRLNRAKYTVIQDTVKTLYPMSTRYINGVVTDLETGNMNCGPWSWVFHCTHKMSSKLVYRNANESSTTADVKLQPLAGGSGEMIFIHYVSEGIGGAGNRGGVLDTSCVPSSVFKDI